MRNQTTSLPLAPVILDTVLWYLLVPRFDEETNPVKLSITELAGPVFSTDWADLEPCGTWCLSGTQVNQQENERKTRGNQWN